MDMPEGRGERLEIWPKEDLIEIESLLFEFRFKFEAGTAGVGIEIRVIEKSNCEGNSATPKKGMFEPSLWWKGWNEGGSWLWLSRLKVGDGATAAGVTSSLTF